jgi:hypothetical protein
MSQETLEEAARRLQQGNGPTLYAIGLMGGELRDPGHEALQRLADGSGGVAFFPRLLAPWLTISAANTPLRTSRTIRMRNLNFNR